MPDPSAHRCATGEPCDVCQPLRIRTAAALGWHGMYEIRGVWFGYPPDASPESAAKEVPAYGETWCSTGSLIKQFGLSLLHNEPDEWRCMYMGPPMYVDGKQMHYRTFPVSTADPLQSIALVVIQVQNAKKEAATTS